jgi:pimeloyl-ACP methyl ester carboxylesterase
MSRSEIDKFFIGKNQKGELKSYELDKRVITYVTSGEETNPLVIFIHGSPGSLSAFIDFLGDSSLLTQFQMITVDRPGFGFSNFGHGEPSLQIQAALLKPLLLDQKKNRPLILVGHSLGGPLIARMAIDYPELIDGLIMVAASISPDLEPKEWYRRPMASPLIKWMLPRSIRASNDELYKLKPQLEILLPHLKEIKIPTIVIQGKSDRLVPFENAYFAHQQMTNSKVTLVMVDGMDHFVPWSNPELIRNAIVEMVGDNDFITSKQ